MILNQTQKIGMAKKNKVVKFVLRIDEVPYKKLKKISEKKKDSINTSINRAVDRYIEDNEHFLILS